MMKSQKMILNILRTVESVLKVCQNNTFLIIESTISPGTIDKHIRPLVSEYEKKSKIRIHISHCPERIIPGNMVYELVHNSRTIGVDRIEVGEEIKILYKSFCQAEMVITSIKVAEITKVVENTFRDVNIAFANELAQIAHSAEIDVYEIIKIANMHPRVKILQPGPGVGGHCLPVDPWFLVGDFPNQTPLIKQARLVNDSMPSYVSERVTDCL